MTRSRHSIAYELLDRLAAVWLVAVPQLVPVRTDSGKPAGRLVLAKSGANDHCSAPAGRQYLRHRN
jgi:hypothetical protein